MAIKLINPGGTLLEPESAALGICRTPPKLMFLLTCYLSHASKANVEQKQEGPADVLHK
jgi:hypothetical protein